MRKLIANEFMGMDGVVQAPSYADEDMIAGFAHGGWHSRPFDDRSMDWVIDSVTGAGGFLLGRRTYELFAAHWPNAAEDRQMLAKPLDALPKYVASRTLSEPLAWEHSTLLRGDLVRAVRALEEKQGFELHVIGIPGLVHSLLVHGLIDELQLMIDPLTLGGGKRLIQDDGDHNDRCGSGDVCTTQGPVIFA
jgi:dihydrofolate reductase